MLDYLNILRPGIPSRGVGAGLKWMVLLAIWCTTSAFSSGLSIDQMTVNARKSPLGISTAGISFAWAITGDERGIRQKSYHIRVGSMEGISDVWDSGKVNSDQQINVTLPDDIRLSSGTRYFWQVKILSEDAQESEWSIPAWFETGLMPGADWSGGEWIASPLPVASEENQSHPTATDLTSDSFLPLFRGEFYARKQIKDARVYATALGIYQLSINGKKVGDQFLAPGWTDYRRRLQTQTYDITSLLGRV